VVYELLTEISWRGAPKDINEWIQNYIHARYGRRNSASTVAWQILLKNIYSYEHVQCPVNSVIAAAPMISEKIRGRAWSSPHVRYDNKNMLLAWEYMLKASEALGDVDTYRYDLADVARQVLCNLSRPVYNAMIAAYRNKNRTELNRHAEILLGLITDLDALTATRREWLMGRWVKDARSWGDNEEEKRYLDHCARVLLTTWVDNPNSSLKDYANREWSGLLREYYLSRWQLFVNTLNESMNTGKEPDWNKSFKKIRGDLELRWITSQSELPSVPQGDTVNIAQNLFNKYKGLVVTYHP
jgi:alpha-N-acetylglucosaminidase